MTKEELKAGLMAAGRADIVAEGLSILGFLKNLAPVTMGNIVGGAGLGAMYWAVYLRKQ